MSLPKYEREPKVETGAPSLRDCWNSATTIPGCIHDPPCKASRQSQCKYVGGAILFLLQGFMSGIIFSIGYYAHFGMAHGFAGSISRFLNNAESKHWKLLYWSCVLPFLVATFLSLRTFEHAFKLSGRQASSGSPRPWAIQFLRLVNLTLFSVVYATSLLTLLDRGISDGQSSMLALVAVGASISLGRCTGAYDKNDWQFRESLSNLVKGHVHETFSLPDTVYEKDNNGKKTQLRGSLRHILYGMDVRRVFSLEIHLPYLYAARTNIERLFRCRFPILSQGGPSNLLWVASWLPRVVFWSLAIHILGTLIQVVAMRRPVSCFGKPIDRNLLRLFTVLPPIILWFVPGGLGDGWKALFVWTLSFTPCIIIGLGTGALRFIWGCGIAMTGLWRLLAALMGVY